MPAGYVGRFAPSPTGPLHAGSAVAALASWLDARAAGGRWLVRIEDLDTARCSAAAAEQILQQLAALGLVPDEPPQWQSTRGALHAAALDRLRAGGWLYACSCSRSRIADWWRRLGVERPAGGEWPYPGFCRSGAAGAPAAQSLRVRAPAAPVDWHDRRLGPQRQDVSQAVGDFVVRRADGVVAYQLAVVVDDAGQGVTDVVRGEDLADNTPRQLHLQALLGLPRPRYLHTPLVVDAGGEKLSKQKGAPALDVADPLATLRTAGRHLGLDPPAASLAEWLHAAVAGWPEACSRLALQAASAPTGGGESR